MKLFSILSGFAVLRFDPPHGVAQFVGILLCFIASVGCTSLEPRETSDQGDRGEPERNEIFFGERWPVGQTFELSDRQAKDLREIAWGTEIEDPFSEMPDKVTVSPASDFSYFTIYGKTFYFVPPSSPHNFRLTDGKQRSFDHFMAEEFGIRARGQTPRTNGRTSRR